MALTYYRDSFNVTTGAAGTTYARSGYGFAPTVILVTLISDNGSTDAVTAGNVIRSFGFATSTTSRYYVASSSQNGSASSNADRSQDNIAVAATINTGGTIDGLLDISSFDSDGITFIVDNDFGDTYRVNVLAIGGTTGADIGTFNKPSSGGTTVSGLSYSPDVILFLAAGTVTGTTTTTGEFYIGASVPNGGTPIDACVSGVAQNGAATMNTYGYARIGDSIVDLNSSTGTFAFRGHVSAYNSDGFTITYDTQSAGSPTTAYLTIKGGNFHIGSSTTQTDTVTDITISSIGFTPGAGLVLSNCRAADSAGTSHSHDSVSMGMFVGTSSQSALATWDEDATANAETAFGQENDECYVDISSSDTLDGSMHVTSLASGSATFRMTDADPSAYFFWALLMEETGGGGGGTYPGWISSKGGWW